MGNGTELPALSIDDATQASLWQAHPCKAGAELRLYLLTWRAASVT